jgi:hypothetical protein
VAKERAAARTADEDRETEASSGERYLKYTGTSDVRVVTKQEWAAIDIDHETVQFDRSNGWMVPVSDITDDQALNYFVSVDPEFKVEKSARVRAAAADVPEQATSVSQLQDAPPLGEAFGGSRVGPSNTGGASGGTGGATGAVGGSTGGTETV